VAQAVAVARSGGIQRQRRDPPRAPLDVHLDRARIPSGEDRPGVRERRGRADLCGRLVASNPLGRDRRNRTAHRDLAGELSDGHRRPARPRARHQDRGLDQTASATPAHLVRAPSTRSGRWIEGAVRPWRCCTSKARSTILNQDVPDQRARHERARVKAGGGRPVGIRPPSHQETTPSANTESVNPLESDGVQPAWSGHDPAATTVPTV
jgi:hypothetical protein